MQTTETSQASNTTLLLWAVVAGLRAGPKVAAGPAGPRNGLGITGWAEYFRLMHISS